MSMMKAQPAKATAKLPAKAMAKLPAKTMTAPAKSPAKVMPKAAAKPAAKAKAPVKAPAKATKKTSQEAMLARVEAVRLSQREEGHFDCFGRAGSGYCDQGACAHHTECLSVSRMIHSM